jgi:hypothetical protein
MQVRLLVDSAMAELNPRIASVISASHQHTLPAMQHMPHRSDGGNPSSQVAEAAVAATPPRNLGERTSSHIKSLGSFKVAALVPFGDAPRSAHPTPDATSTGAGHQDRNAISMGRSCGHLAGPGSSLAQSLNHSRMDSLADDSQSGASPASGKDGKDEYDHLCSNEVMFIAGTHSKARLQLSHANVICHVALITGRAWKRMQILEALHCSALSKVSLGVANAWSWFMTFSTC